MQNFRRNLVHQYQGNKQLLLVKDILGKPPDERQESDIKYIAEIIKDHRYFIKCVNDPQERFEFAIGCAKYLKYRHQKRGTQVFAHGDAGSEFFIVYKGKVTVFTPKNFEEWNALNPDDAVGKRESYSKYMEYMKNHALTAESNSAVFKKKGTFDRIKVDFTPLLSKMTSEFLKHEPDNQDDIMRKNILDDKGTIWQGEPRLGLSFEERLLLLNSRKNKNYFENGLAAFKAINTLGEGDYFGEIALIFRINRTASIIAMEDAHLFYLSADDYKLIFNSQINNIIKKVDFGVRVFPNLSRKMVMKFCYLLEEKAFQHGEIIYKEGDKPDALYLVKSGQVQISRLIEAESPAKHGMMMKKKSHFRQKLVLSNLQEGNFFGEVELLEKIPRSATAVSNSMNTLCYKVSQRDFDNVVKIYFPYILNSLKEAIKNKKEWKETMIEKQEKIMLKNFLTEEDYHEKKENDVHFETPNVGILKEKLVEQRDTPKKKTWINLPKSETEELKPKFVHMKVDGEKEKKRLSLYTRTLKFTDKGVERIPSIDKSSHNTSHGSSSKEKSERSSERTSTRPTTVASNLQSPTSASQFAKIFQRVITSSKVSKPDDSLHSSSSADKIVMPPIATTHRPITSSFRPDLSTPNLKPESSTYRPEILTLPDNENLSSEQKINILSQTPSSTRNGQLTSPHSQLHSPQNFRAKSYIFSKNNANTPSVKTTTPSQYSAPQHTGKVNEYSLESLIYSPTSSSAKTQGDGLTPRRPDSKRSIEVNTQRTLDLGLQTQPSTFSPRRIVIKHKSMHGQNNLRVKTEEDDAGSGDQMFGITTIALGGSKSPDPPGFHTQTSETLPDEHEKRGSVKFTRFTSSRT